jgi:hypothetical protein
LYEIIDILVQQDACIQYKASKPDETDTGLFSLKITHKGHAKVGFNAIYVIFQIYVAFAKAYEYVEISLMY